MKRFIDYLTETKKDGVYSFKVKIAGPLIEKCEEKMKAALQKFSVVKCTRILTTPIQASLTDFPSIKNSEVSIFDVEVEYPLNSVMLANHIAEHAGIPLSTMLVRTADEQKESDANNQGEGDGCTKEKAAPTINGIGEKGKASFLKELEKVRQEHQPTQVKDINANILAKESPKGTKSELPTENGVRSPFTAVSNPNPRKGKTK